MRIALFITLAFVVFFTPRFSTADLPLAEPEAVGMSSEKLDRINTLMQERVENEKLAGAVVIVARRGKVVFFEAYGKRDLAKSKPMEKDTIVRIYSMTKAIATAAALQLVEEGKLNVDDPVADYVPAMGNVKVWTEEGLVAPRRPMTIADLMRHTAGFGRSGDDEVGKAMKAAKIYEAKDLDDFASRLASVPLAYHPGERWVYSNSIDILGLVVQKVAGKPFADVLDERFFTPLGMEDTGFYVPESKRDRFAVNYNRKEGQLEPNTGPGTNERYHQMPGLQSGGGGLVGTAGDYMKFLLMIANDGEWDGKRYLQPETVELMTTDQLPQVAFPIAFGSQVRHGTGFGFGFNVRTADTEWDPAAHVGEYGWGGAASTHYWVSPQDDDLIVVTLEQVMPYNFETEWALKPVIYGAIEE